MSLNLNSADWIAVEKEACSRSLVDFIRLAWNVLEPEKPYIHGWHIDAMAEHLEAVSRGQIKRLLINCPPGVMKSLMVGVFWPMWEWANGNFSYRYVGASHAQHLAMRDNMRSRRLFCSEWYQERWPCALADDQNAKLKFENAKFGFREAVASASMTGSRGDRVLIDDPHNVEGALSDAQRETTIRWFAETVPTRLNDPKKSAIVVIMQRLHEYDVAGFILERELGYDHLMLPMEYEPDHIHMTNSSIGFEDPRTEDGELLFPERFPSSVVEEDKKAMGEMATASQYQQRPTPRGGGMIKASRFVVDEPGEILQRVRAWDKAGSKGKGAYTAGVLMGVDADRCYWILDVVRGQWSMDEREAVIKQTAQLDGSRTDIWVEQEPGSGGKDSAEATIKNLAGFNARAERATGDKATRAEPFAAQVGIGNVKLKRAEWNRAFIDECRTFPVGRYKDQVDAAAAAFVKLTQGAVIRIRSVG